MQTYVLPYKSGSRSAKALAESLGARVVGLNRSRIHNQTNARVVNWGNSGGRLPPNGVPDRFLMLNGYSQVSLASNKLESFRRMSSAGVRVPEFTTDVSEAIDWVNDGRKIVERHVLTGNSGEGTRIVDNTEGTGAVQQAPLYVQYIKKQDEYRVHVARCTTTDLPVVFDVQRKKRSTDVSDDNVNWQVRNTAGGFIFGREHVSPRTVPADVVLQAKKALQALDLDFGAVDVIWNAHRQEAYVLEVNTAPGLQGTTLERYTDMIQNLFDNQRVHTWFERFWELSPTDDVQSTQDTAQDPIQEQPTQEPDRLQEIQTTIQELQAELMRIREGVQL